MGQQGISDFQYPQLISLSRYNDVTNIPYDPEAINEFRFGAPTPARPPAQAPLPRSRPSDQERLEILNRRPPPPPKPYQLSFYETMVKIKDTWFGILDDLLHQQFYIETFTKENRLFYIGLTLVLVVILIYLLALLLSDPECPVPCSPYACATPCACQRGGHRIIEIHI